MEVGQGPNWGSNAKEKNKTVVLLLDQAVQFKTFLLRYTLLARNKTAQVQGLGSKIRYAQIKSIFHTKHGPVTRVRIDKDT
jgi:hypothetical protein